MGDEETLASANAEPPLGYHPCDTGVLTCGHNLVGGHCQVGSLTGAVASERVSEALKGWLSMDGNHAKECKRTSQPDCERDISSRNESWS